MNDDKKIQNGVITTSKTLASDTTQLPDVPWYKSCRLMLAFVSAWGYVFFYVLRIDLSMAIVCMVREPSTENYHNRFQSNSTLAGNYTYWDQENDKEMLTSSPVEMVFNSTTAPVFHHPPECGGASLLTGNQTAKKSRNKGELEWSKAMRGYILSSFFYGYIVTQVPGGWLASRFGGKHVYGIGVLITLIATLLVPVAARTHAYLLIVLRVIMGLGCGVGFPATHHLYGQWLPPYERSKLMAFSYAGTYVGTIIALIFSGLLCDIEIDNGWPLIFYVYGGVTFIWWICWNFFVYSSPESHPRIDPIERDYIMKTVGASAYEKSTDVPWLEIFKSPAVWAIITSHACNNWANYTILMCIPMYMKEVLKFDIKQNGALSALPHIISYVSAIISGQVADTLRKRKVLTTTTTRKLFQCLSSGVPAVLIVSMGFIDCRLRYVAVALLCLTLFFNSFCRAGFMVNHVDISPRHAGILFGISNTAATVPGMLAPTVVGLLTPAGTREEWLKVFLICGGFYVFSTIVYGLLADGKEQSWAHRHQAKEEKKATSSL